MKSYMIVIIIGTSLTVHAETSSEFRNAIRDGAVGKYVYRVVDDEGVPVSNAAAHVWFKSYGRPQDKADWIIETDTNGMFAAEHRFNEKFSVGIDKEGYYHTHDEVNYFGMASPIVVDGKWQPYGETRTVVLKKIKNPIRLRDPGARYRHKYPESGEWAGFDLVRGDWVSPLGNGECTDVMIRYVREPKPDGYFKSLDISFTNRPYAGAYTMNKDSFSEMDSVYEANTNGEYIVNLRYEFERTARGNHVISELGSGHYLVFRIRTETDDDGNLVSAHYGRIMGPLQYLEKGGMVLGPVYYNPIPNDANLEDAETYRKSLLRKKQKEEFERRRKAGGK